jgi:hypothetical protein
LPANQALTFGSGVSVQAFTIQVSDDNTLESSETLTATLSSPSGAGFVTGSSAATVTLLNDDALFTLSTVSGSLAADEGSGSNRDVVMRVTRSGHVDSSGTVDYARPRMRRPISLRR